jgi:hypothetical protein
MTIQPTLAAARKNREKYFVIDSGSHPADNAGKQDNHHLG